MVSGLGSRELVPLIYLGGIADWFPSLTFCFFTLYLGSLVGRCIGRVMIVFGFLKSGWEVESCRELRRSFVGVFCFSPFSCSDVKVTWQ